MAENPHETSLPLLDEVKLQARVLLPVIRALRERLGREAADALVGTALRAWSRDLHRRIGEDKGGSGRERWDALWADLRPRIGNAVERELLRDDAEARNYNITRCAYADFFKALGEPELGRFLLCDLDIDVAEVGAPDVQFTRTQTIMAGAPYCDFRYRFSRRDGSGPG